MVHTGVRRQRQRSRPTCARQQRSALAHLQAEPMSSRVMAMRSSLTTLRCCESI